MALHWRRKSLASVMSIHDPVRPPGVNPSDNSHASSSPAQAPAPATPALLHRHMSVWDLLSLGVGGTVGSGIFVLTGQLAASVAGRAVVLSLAIAGLAAGLSGACYAELAARIPTTGSTYVYAHVCLGEGAAVVAAACLTLEYEIAGAAVARTWGDKMLRLILSYTTNSNITNSSNIDNPTGNSGNWQWLQTWLQPGNVVNLPACLISALCTLLLLAGVQESKRVLNVVTTMKMILVLIMIVFGFYLYNAEAVSSTSWAPFGAAGILRGATSSFFGYLGYDEICCVAGEARNPTRDLPRAVLGTLAIVTSCYILAAAALTGMLPYTALSPTAGFPDAFEQRDWQWTSHFTAWGEICTLPVVVLISLLAQPRLTLSMSLDGLLPHFFQSVDASGNLWNGTLVAGLTTTVIATFVPFTFLDDLISAGILIAFCLTNICLVLLRCESPHFPTSSTSSSSSFWCGGALFCRLEYLLVVYNALCLTTAMLWSHNSWSTASSPSSEYMQSMQSLAAMTSSVATIACLVHLVRTCPQSAKFGGSILGHGDCDADASTPASVKNEEAESKYFTTPFVPYWPCLGMAVNWYLIAQLSLTGILLLLIYLGISLAFYFCYCRPNDSSGSLGGDHGESERGNYQTIRSISGFVKSDDYDDNGVQDEYIVNGETELCGLPSIT